ncbi:MAG: hypothetical protein OXI51_10565 [Chloroflexota bacterium]|nr:hypothetical protein [Chloroflexota bacterium]
MKRIRVAFDEALLERLDRHAAVAAEGRSVFVRKAVVSYLARLEASDEIDRRYEEGYRRFPQTDEELDWGESQVWPEDWLEGDD